MKRVGSFVLGFVFMLALSGVVVAVECVDSDGGKDYYTKGTIYDSSYSDSQTDRCASDINLLEGICNSQGMLFLTYNCPNGCFEGACSKDSTNSLGNTVYVITDKDDSPSNKILAQNLRSWMSDNLDSKFSYVTVYDDDMLYVDLDSTLAVYVYDKRVVVVPGFNVAPVFHVMGAGIDSYIQARGDLGSCPVVSSKSGYGLMDYFEEYCSDSYCGNNVCAGSTDFIITEGYVNTVVVNNKEYGVMIEYIDSTSAVLTVNGELTGKLDEGDVYQTDDGMWISLNYALYSQKETGISKVEITLGENEITCPSDCGHNRNYFLSSGQSLSIGDYDVVLEYISEDSSSLKVSPKNGDRESYFVLDRDVYYAYGDDYLFCFLDSYYDSDNIDSHIVFEVHFGDLTGLVCELPTTPEFPKNTITVDVNEGWNLIYGFFSPEQIISGDINEEDIIVTYVLLASIQEYAMLWPEFDYDKVGGAEEEQIISSGMWVYSDKSGVMIYEEAMSYEGNGDVLPLNEREIYAGWNFVGVSEDMIGEDKLADMVGDCDIRKSYAFDSSIQEWDEILLTVQLGMRDIGKVWVINVAEDCKLGGSEAVIVAPPVLPVIGDDGFVGIALIILVENETSEIEEEFTEEEESEAGDDEEEVVEEESEAGDDVAEGVPTIDEINGMVDMYFPRDTITLSVEVTDHLGNVASSGNGWNVQYYTYDVSNNSQYMREYLSSGNYNAAYYNNKWHISYLAPLDAGDYYTKVIFYCPANRISCLEGFQINEEVSFSVDELSVEEGTGPGSDYINANRDDDGIWTQIP